MTKQIVATTTYQQRPFLGRFFVLFAFIVFFLPDLLWAGVSGPVMILNLHFEEGEVTLNSFKVYNGRIHNKKLSSEKFLSITDRSGKTFFTKAFKIPQKLHYDYMDTKTGELKGGELTRDKVDFIVKVPFSKNMKKIQFFQSKSKVDTGQKNKSEESNTLIGTIDFDVYE